MALTKVPFSMIDDSGIFDSIRTQRPAWYSFPRLMRKITTYNTVTSPAIKIVGFGSSVGVGATLPDAATQAPVAVFTSKFKSAIDPAGIYNITAHNYSVNGSSVSQAITALDTAVAAGDTPDICVLVYGMNDGAPAIYNAGQTYPYVYTNILQFVDKARSYGADVVLLTSPHPNTDTYTYSMPVGISQSYPTTVASPVTPEQLVPSASTSNITGDFLGTGVDITIAHRHYRVNQAMRQAATDAGIAVIDAERYWFEAVSTYGVAALFNTSETVHPNLLGHQKSYWLAINEFLESMAWQTAQEGQEPRLNGLCGVNNASPSAVLDISSPYPNSTSPTIRVRARVGVTGGDGVKASVQVWDVEQATGDLVGYGVKTTDNTPIEAYRHHYNMDGTGTIVANTRTINTIGNGTTITTINEARYNVSGAQSIITTTDNSTGAIYISARQSGIGAQRIRVEWAAYGGAVYLGTPESVGAAVVSVVSSAGLTISATMAAANTNFVFTTITTDGF